jgi:hypothetical protein
MPNLDKSIKIIYQKKKILPNPPLLKRRNAIMRRIPFNKGRGGGFFF